VDRARRRLGAFCAFRAYSCGFCAGSVFGAAGRACGKEKVYGSIPKGGLQGTPEADQIRARLATDRSEVIQAVSLSADPSPRRTRLVIRGNPVRDPDHSRWPAGVTERPDLRP